MSSFGSKGARTLDQQSSGRFCASYSNVDHRNIRRTLSITQIFESLFGGKRLKTMSLADLVTLVADEPTPVNRDAFYRKLIVSKVGSRTSNLDDSMHPGERVQATGDKIGIPTTTRPDGIRYLTVYCDIPAMFRVFPKDTFVEVEARVVLQMAKNIGGGIIVYNGLDGRQSWVGVPREHVDELLSDRHT